MAWGMVLVMIIVLRLDPYPFLAMYFIDARDPLHDVCMIEFQGGMG